MSYIEFQICADDRQLLEAAGYASFENLMLKNDGELISSEKRAQTLRLDLPAPNGTKICFLKRTLVHRRRKNFQALMQFARPHTDVYREMQLAQKLRDAGIPAMRILAWGEERKFGFPIRGFILTEAVTGMSLDEMFRTGNARMRRRIVAAFGSFVARLHERGFFQTVRLKDLICADSDSPDLKLTLIDRAASNCRRKFFWSHFCLQALARGFRRMKRDQVVFEGELERVFADAYVKSIAPKWKITSEKLLAKVTASSEAKTLPSRILRGARQTYQILVIHLATSGLWNIDEIDGWFGS